MAQQFAFFKNGLADRKFHGFVDLIQKEVEDYFDENWGDSGEKCLFQALSELFTLTSARCLLGEEIREKWKGEFAGHYHALDHSFVPIMVFFPNFPNPHRSRCVEARKVFEQLFTDVMKKRQETGEEYDDFLQVLMGAKYKDGKKLSMSEITGILIGTLLGGQHTSNVTGSWLLCHLFKDEKWLKVIMDEQERITDGHLDHNLTYDQVNEMTEFDKLLEETLRLHPPFFQLMRVAQKQTRFGDYTIPAGNFVAVSPGAAQRTEELWGADPEAWKPERWTSSQKEKHVKNSWIPFGGGRHQCSGRKFALVSLKTALSWLLRNYKLEFSKSEIPKDDYTTMVVAPSAPVLFKYSRR
jgi:sterol 14-demethylase